MRTIWRTADIRQVKAGSAQYSMLMKTSVGSLGVITAIVGLGCVLPAGAEDSAARQITVDATVTVGTLRPFSGVQAADAEGTAFYRAARVDLVRIHDVSPAADIDAIFPDAGADVEDPKSYRFGPADRLVTSIKSGGAEPLFDLYGSAGAVAAVPDPDKWAQIVRHIVLHYNAGWNKGFRYGIRYWEVWNAPDSELSWRGTPQEYYALYEKAAQAIQSADDAALVGGPGLSKPLIAGAYREKFFDFVRVRRLPLDFFSWHFRTVDSNDPYLFVSIARQLRTILDSHGFGSTHNLLDEWGADPGDKEMSKTARAAFATSALIYMLGGPIDAQTYAGGAADSVDRTLETFGSMKSTPQLVRTTGGDDAGFAVMAARSLDRRLIQVLIGNYQVAPKFLSHRDNWDTTLPERRLLQYHDNGGYDASISVPTAGKYQVKRFRSDDSGNFTLVDQSMQNGPNLHLQAALPPPAVELIVISAK
jgi:xylan 1,4-beta-xylosidase